MTSRTTKEFRGALARLPAFKPKARVPRVLLETAICSPGLFLNLRRVHPSDPIFSVRISLGYRAVGVRESDEIVWFWIGSHAEYERLLSTL